jgi:hypothetical protein
MRVTSILGGLALLAAAAFAGLAYTSSSHAPVGDLIATGLCAFLGAGLLAFEAETWRLNRRGPQVPIGERPRDFLPPGHDRDEDGAL